MSEYARLLGSSSSSNQNSSRFRGENVMRLGLDRAGRTTRDYEGPAVAPRVQAALDEAMRSEEPDIDIDVGTLSNRSAVRGMMKRNKGNNVRKKPRESQNEAAYASGPSYPESRGTFWRNSFSLA